MPQTCIEIKDLSFAWPNSAPVLQIPGVSVARGSRVFLMGESGSGKSTLLGLIAGIHTAQSGRVQVLGHAFDTMAASKRDDVRADAIGVIFQQFNLVPYLSLVENVLLPLQFSQSRARRVGTSWAERRAKANDMLERLGLSAELRTNKTTGELSVGQQQRVAAARALIGGPSLIIADEPTSALDAKTRGAFIELLLCEADGAAVLFVSHDETLADNFDRHLSMAEINKTPNDQTPPNRGATPESAVS